jgi:hypothetical protein
MCKSEAQLTGCSLQRSYSWNSATTSSLCYRKNNDPQIHSAKEDCPQNNSWGSTSSQLFWSPEHNSGEFNLIVHSDQTTKLSKAWAITFLILPAFLPRMVRPCKTYFSLWYLLKKRILCKIIWHLVTKVENMYVEAIPSISIHQIWILSTSDSQLKHSFFLAFLCSCIRIEKKIVFSLS